MSHVRTSPRNVEMRGPCHNPMLVLLTQLKCFNLQSQGFNFLMRKAICHVKLYAFTSSLPSHCKYAFCANCNTLLLFESIWRMSKQSKVLIFIKRNYLKYIFVFSINPKPHKTNLILLPLDSRSNM